MTATAQKSTGGELNDTVDFRTGPERPAGSPNMANPTPQAHYRYKSGARPLNGFTIKRAIGRGGFGEVYYATSDSGKEVALKLITRNELGEYRGNSQCMNLKCQNLLTIYDILRNDEGSIFVVMEYVSGPSLASALEKYPNGMPVNEARAWLKGLVEGVDYLHDHGIVHRDLKPANLFLEEGIVKIGDYGLSKIISTQQGSEHSESIGTCHYMAPEISTGKYHKPIDIYAIGVILFEMLTGRVPFEGETVGEVLMKHLTTRPDLSRLSEPYRTIVGEALSKDPVNRPKRAHDLLGIEDGGRTRDVRFIGDGKSAPNMEPPPATKNKGWFGGGKKERAQFRPTDDDVLRIGEVDPPLYIGPDTKPPRPVVAPRPSPVPAIRWIGDVIRRPGNVRLANYRPSRPVVETPRPRPVAPAPRRPAPPAPTPPIEPVAPTTRVRVGELMGSMVKSAVMIGVGTWLLATFGDFRPALQVENVALLFATTLLGTWGVLIGNKITEANKASNVSRRLIGLLTGVGLGLAAGLLADWLNVSLGIDTVRPRFLINLGFANALPATCLPLMAYFGLTYTANGWWKHADRDRSSRLKVLSLLGAAVIAGVMIPALPYRETWLVGIVPAVALVTQLSSPWSRPAAAYAAYVRKNKPMKIV